MNFTHVKCLETDHPGITPGKVYQVEQIFNCGAFKIYDDCGCYVTCQLKDCPHIGGDWIPMVLQLVTEQNAELSRTEIALMVLPSLCIAFPNETEEQIARWAFKQADAFIKHLNEIPE